MKTKPRAKFLLLSSVKSVYFDNRKQGMPPKVALKNIFATM